MSEFRGPQYGPPPGPPPGYGPSAYGPPVYGPPAGYGPPSGYGPPLNHAAARWPYGPGRPGLATAAAVLGFVTAGLTIVVTLAFVVVLLTGNGDPTVGALVLGLPCAVGMIVGGVRLTARRSSEVLFASAATAVGVLLFSLVVGIGYLVPGDLAGQAVFVATALPLPVLTAVFSRAATVKAWLAARG